MRAGRHLRSDVLQRTCLGWVLVGRHVTTATTSGRHDRGLQSGRLKVLGQDLGRLGDVANVSSASTACRLHVASHFVMCGWLRRRVVSKVLNKLSSRLKCCADVSFQSSFESGGTWTREEFRAPTAF